MLDSILAYMRGDNARAAEEARTALEVGAGEFLWLAVPHATLGTSLLWLGAESGEVEAELAAAIELATPGENMIAALRALGAHATSSSTRETRFTRARRSLGLLRSATAMVRATTRGRP